MALGGSVLKVLDAWLGPALCAVLTRANGHEVPAPASVRRILVLRPGGMGDMLLLLPALDALRARYPEAAIDLLCERRNADVIALARRRATPLLYDARPLRTVRHLRRHAYDIAIDSEQFHHFSAVLAVLSGAPFRIGFKINPRRNPLYSHLVNYAPDGPEAAQFLRLLEPLGIVPGEDGIPPSVTGLLPLEGGDEPKTRYAVIHPGAPTRYKQWPMERYIEVSDRLGQQHGVEIVFVGGRADGQAAVHAAATLKARGVSRARAVTGRPLAEIAELIRDALLYVGFDSGLAHLAVAAGTPTVVLFGPSDHKKWGLHDARHRVVSRPQPCAPCFIFGYHRPCRHIQCMDRITVEDVLQACEALLETSAAIPPQPRT